MIAHRSAYELQGPSGAPVVILIHGLGLTRQTWREFVPALAQAYRVLTYDLLGHGESPLPESVPSLTILSDQLRALMDALQIERATLIGFSIGGMINRRFAMDYPDRVAALVILNSPHERSPDEQRLVEKRAAATGAGGPAATITATLERWFTPTFRSTRSHIVEWVRDKVLANDPDNYTKYRQVLASGVIELIRPEPHIVKPTLVITCENDSGSTPAMSQAIASEIVGAEAVIIPDLQHLGLLERPDLFIEPINRFLERSLREEAFAEKD